MREIVHVGSNASLTAWNGIVSYKYVFLTQFCYNAVACVVAWGYICNHCDIHPGVLICSREDTTCTYEHFVDCYA